MTRIIVSPSSHPCLPPLTLYRAKQDEKTIFANVDDYEHRVQRAMVTMDRMRCPLSHADNALYDEMRDAIDEYIMDNNLAEDYDFAIDDIIF